jgi:queuine tRNA-ribosyltransferase
MALKSLETRSGNLEFPVFLPDATLGVVRSLDAKDLETCQVQAVVMNTYHLMLRPGSTTISSLGGLHQMSGWEKPIFTDSGGFQIYSLIHQNPKFGKISDDGITFKPEGSTRKYQLTPEKCIQLQMGYDSDIIICLDDCTHVDASRGEQEASVRRTTAWAKRCKNEYLRLLKEKKLTVGQQPKIFAVVQGGGYEDLRKQCADELLSIGFDGYGFGGWPLDGKGNLLSDILEYVRQVIPAQFPLHALGVGHPENVAACHTLGYSMFDSAMPTRDARHARLYVFTERDELNAHWFEYLYINDEKHIKKKEPISKYCDCFSCCNYSIGYLRHLFKIEDTLYYRLATIHNVRFMTQLCERMKQS